MALQFKKPILTSDVVNEFILLSNDCVKSAAGSFRQPFTHIRSFGANTHSKWKESSRENSYRESANENNEVHCSTVVCVVTPTLRHTLQPMIDNADCAKSLNLDARAVFKFSDRHHLSQRQVHRQNLGPEAHSTRFIPPPIRWRRMPVVVKVNPFFPLSFHSLLITGNDCCIDQPQCEVWSNKKLALNTFWWNEKLKMKS